MKEAAYDRVRSGLHMPGLYLISQAAAIGQVIEDLILLAECSREGEWEGKVIHIPL